MVLNVRQKQAGESCGIATTLASIRSAPAQPLPPCPRADAIVRMLHFNAAPSLKTAGDEDVYKVCWGSWGSLLPMANCRSCSNGVVGSAAVSLQLCHQTMLPSGACSNPRFCFMSQVLILDRYTKEVLAPLLRVNELRRHGVTLHMLLDSERQPIPDVPAVYFVEPSETTIQVPT